VKIGKTTSEDEQLTTNLPPELAAFASLLDAQPAPVRAMFYYCLALAMAATGKARLVETVPGENGPVCTFETVAGERFSLPAPARPGCAARAGVAQAQVARPAMSKEVEEDVKEMLRAILEEEPLD
jgi:hypothetical protein